MTSYVEAIVMRLIRRLLPFAIIAPPDGSAGVGTDATVEDAANRGAKIIFVKPGTYAGVTLTSITGTIIIGPNSAIFDGTTVSHGFKFNAGCSDCMIIGCQFKTTAGGGTAFDALSVAAGCDDLTFIGIHVSGSDDHGLIFNTDTTSANHTVIGGRFDSCDTNAIYNNSNRGLIVGNFIGGSYLNESSGDNAVIVGNKTANLELATSSNGCLLVANGTSTVTNNSSGSTVANNLAM